MLHERHLFDPRNLSSLCIPPLHNKIKKQHSRLPYPAMPVHTCVQPLLEATISYHAVLDPCLYTKTDTERSRAMFIRYWLVEAQQRQGRAG